MAKVGTEKDTDIFARIVDNVLWSDLDGPFCGECGTGDVEKTTESDSDDYRSWTIVISECCGATIYEDINCIIEKEYDPSDFDYDEPYDPDQHYYND